MTDINQVTVSGNLTRDAELKKTNSGASVKTGTVAVNRAVKKGDSWEDEVYFLDFALWGKLGEMLDMPKGAKCVLAGEIRQQKWQDKSGKNQSRVYIYVRDILVQSRRDKPQEQQPSDDEIPF